MLKRLALITTMSCTAALSSVPILQAQKSHVKNIVLAHGVWADSSGWTRAYDEPVSDGLNVSAAVKR